MKLRVGEIEMDTESGVSFATGVVASGSDQSSRSEPLGLLVQIAGAPRWAHAIVSSGALLVASVTAVTAWVMGWWLLLIPAAAFLRLGAYAGFLAFAPRGAALPVRSSASQSAQVRATVIEDGELTIDRLVAKLGWAEREVLEVVADLVSRQELEEDLDLESGHWVYRATTTFSGLDHPGTQPAAERLRAIERQHQSTGVPVEN